MAGQHLAVPPCRQAPSLQHCLVFSPPTSTLRCCLPRFPPLLCLSPSAALALLPSAGKTFPSQASPSTFHVDCPPPVTASSACTVSIQLFEDLGPQVDIVALNSASHDCLPAEEGGPSCADRRALAAAAEADPDVQALREWYANPLAGNAAGRRLETP